MDVNKTMNENQFRFECNKLIFDKETNQKRISKIKKFVPLKKGIKTYTMIGRNIGRYIKCPHCDNIQLVFHFNWTALGCSQCHKTIEKNDLLVEVK